MNNSIVRLFVGGSGRTLPIFLFIIVSIFSTSCVHQKNITTNNKCVIDYKNASTLTYYLDTNEFRFDKLNAKLSAEIMVDSTFNSFTISLRMKKDSIIWMSISKLGIEGVRVLITKDSVKFFNRMNSTYFKGDFTYFSNILNTEVDFETLQSLLVGNSVEFYDEDEKIKPGIDNCQYTLGTIRKYKLRKVARGKELNEPVQSIYMIPKTYKISRILFYEFNPSRSLDVHFDEFTAVDSTQLFPNKINFAVKAQKKNISIDLHYTKLKLNEEQSFPFKIPYNYEPISYKEKQ